MKSLELRIPPPALGAAMALAMWALARLTPGLQMPDALRLGIAAVTLSAGVGFSASGLLAFRRARTTVDPTRPERASSLVRSGVYRITRNPMYVGLAFVLLGWAVFLSSAFALVGPAAFVLYIGRFQIAPEERTLARLFGSEYESYRAEVRRWL